MEFRSVCRYFLEGRCRFGQACRNEHVYNDNRGGNNDQNNILWKIANEVTAAEKGGQWPLTSFAPIVQRSGLPGWEDISPEEVRWTLYEAQKNGTVNQALNQISQWYKNAERNRNLVKEKSPEVARVINDIISGNPRSPFQSSKPSSGFDTSGGNIFSSANRGVFGNQTQSNSNNIFAIPQQQQQQPQSGQNIFSNGLSTGQNIFSGSSGSVFGQGFSSPSPANQNIFQAPQSPQPTSNNIFQNAAPAFGGSNAFTGSANIFGGGQTTNAFQPNNNNNNQGAGFGVTPSFRTENTGFGNMSSSVKEVDLSAYSKIESLTEKEINAFNSTTFAFGEIPLKPPPQQNC